MSFTRLFFPRLIERVEHYLDDLMQHNCDAVIMPTVIDEFINPFRRTEPVKDAV